MAQQPRHLHPVLVGHFVQIHLGAHIGRLVQGLLRQDFAVVFYCFEGAATGKGFYPAPLFSEVVGQRLAAAFQIANGGQELNRDPRLPGR